MNFFVLVTAAIFGAFWVIWMHPALKGHKLTQFLATVILPALVIIVPGWLFFPGMNWWELSTATLVGASIMYYYVEELKLNSK